MSKKKYYFAGFTVLLITIFAYHFYAASQAEQQIDEVIQEQVNNRDSISVQYSSIDVAPFGASVSMRDLTFIFGNHIERVQELHLDISYLDVLNIYIGGITYGLDRLERANIQFINPSYVNKSGLQEIKMDTLTITYSGNALDGLLSAIKGTSFPSAQSIETRGKDMRISLPKTTLSNIRANTFQYSGSIPQGQKNFWLHGQHQFRMDSLTWTPSKSFQNTYSFFIKGFGYATDAIPLQSAQLHSSPTSQPGILKIEATLTSELALLSGSGLIELQTPLPNSEFQNMNIRMTDFSDSFSNVLSNIERLLSISLPKSDGKLSLQLQGTLSNPSIVK